MSTIERAIELATKAHAGQKDEQLAFLRANGCDELQGYLISKPVSAWQMTKLLVSREARSAA